MHFGGLTANALTRVQFPALALSIPIPPALQLVHLVPMCIQMPYNNRTTKSAVENLHFSLPPAGKFMILFHACFSLTFLFGQTLFQPFLWFLCMVAENYKFFFCFLLGNSQGLLLACLTLVNL